MRKKLLLLMMLVAVLTAGCVQADLKLDVKDDGSGTYSAVLAVNAELFKSLGGLGALIPDAAGASKSTDVCQQMIDNAKSDNPEGAKVEPYKDGDFCGVKVSAPFKDIDTAVALLNSGTAAGGTSLEDITLEKQGNGWAFDAQWSPSSAGALTGGIDAGSSKQLLQGFSFVIRIKLPGGQVEQNADLIEGDGTMVWNLEPTTDRALKAVTDADAPVIKNKVLTDAGKSVNATGSGSAASSGDDGGSSKTWLYVVIGLVVIAGIAAFVLMKRNKTKAVPPAATPDPSLVSGPMTTPPVEASAASGAPSDPFAPSTIAPPVAAAPVATAPQPAATEPQWDAARNAYIQWDGVNERWMQYDQTAEAWKPIE